MEVHNRNLFEPVVAHFANKVPAREYWELHSPVEASVGISGGKIKQVQNALIGWITANASALPVTRFGDRYPYSAQKESTPGVPFRFALYRSSVPDCGLSGVFWRREGISGNLEDARRSRLEPGFLRWLPYWREYSRFSGLPARQKRGSDGYGHRAQPERWSRG